MAPTKTRMPLFHWISQERWQNGFDGSDMAHIMLWWGGFSFTIPCGRRYLDESPLGRPHPENRRWIGYWRRHLEIYFRWRRMDGDWLRRPHAYIRFVGLPIQYWIATGDLVSGA